MQLSQDWEIDARGVMDKNQEECKETEAVQFWLVKLWIVVFHLCNVRRQILGSYFGFGNSHL